MEQFLEYQRPSLDNPVLLCAFAGWPDAGEAATTALRYLVGKLGAKKFGELDPEEFYDFSHLRPQLGYDIDGDRVITWPSNELFYWHGSPQNRDLVVMIGVEPHLRWRTFVSALMHSVTDLGVNQVVHMGSLMDAVPHTRAVHISGSARGTKLEGSFHQMGIRGSGYRGPTGASAVFVQACRKEGLPTASIWGHSPHYLQVSPNPTVSYALLETLEKIVEIGLDLEELRTGVAGFSERVERALMKDPQISSYVRQLEQQYDQREPTGTLPSSDEMVKDLEDFLRSQRGHGKESQDSPPGI